VDPSLSGLFLLAQAHGEPHVPLASDEYAFAMMVFIGAVAFSLFVSFICSTLEAVLLSLTPAQIASMQEKHPKPSKIWQHFKQHIEEPIAVILLLNTAAHTIGASVAGLQFGDLFGAKYIMIFSLGFTYVMLQFTEILPKTMGVKFNKELAVYIAVPLQWLLVVFSPITKFVNFVNKPFEGRKLHGSADQATIAEISTMAGFARLSNLIGQQQERIIIQASRLSSRKVKEIMVPADDIIMLFQNSPLTEVIVQIHLDLHTRFPVTNIRADPQGIVGYVNFKELVLLAKTHPQNPKLTEITRPLFDFNQDLSVSEALRQMVANNLHLAIVKNTAGQIVGLITQEDIFEELVGDIDDEFDRLPKHVISSGRQWVVGGGATVGRARQVMNRTDFAPSSPPETGISQWICDKLEDHPKGGDTATIDGSNILVRKVRRHKVTEALIDIDPKS
jgi:putative hemolysin